ncbi:MAG TPA: alkaline phosphatase family protein [Opitutaceae bacterium]|nr:alkaline phosphatase family protein [Opitutaceae bacterium]
MEERHRPDLALVYLPHLDYNLQRKGPADTSVAVDYREIDQVVGELMAFYGSRGVRSVVLSEYGITQVNRSIALNRVFRARGWIQIKEELGTELMDCGASKVFAIADHQVAHVYVNDPALLNSVRSVLEGVAGVARVLGTEEQRLEGLDHARSGDLVVFSDEDAWFTYYYWEDETKAPDFARCVDIHRKYGYDPVELFVDPKIFLPQLKVAGKLARKRLGFRILMNVISLDPSLVKGSHGTCPADSAEWPVLIGAGRLGSDDAGSIPALDVFERLLEVCGEQKKRKAEMGKS